MSKLYFHRRKTNEDDSGSLEEPLPYPFGLPKTNGSLVLLCGLTTGGSSSTRTATPTISPKGISLS
jgi:hypothetical protein